MHAHTHRVCSHVLMPVQSHIVRTRRNPGFAVWFHFCSSSPAPHQSPRCCQSLLLGTWCLKACCVQICGGFPHGSNDLCSHPAGLTVYDPGVPCKASRHAVCAPRGPRPAADGGLPDMPESHQQQQQSPQRHLPACAFTCDRAKPCLRGSMVRCSSTTGSWPAWPTVALTSLAAEAPLLARDG